MTSPPPPHAASEREAQEPEAKTLAGLSGFGGRPSLHPSWREPDDGSMAEPSEPAPLVVIRLSETGTG